MQIAMLAADFTAGEADALRRAMAAWKRKGGLGPFHERLVGRMVEKGYDARIRRAHLQADRGLRRIRLPRKPRRQLRAARLRQRWLKCHHPDAFLAALLNSQPMGFYAPAQLVRDAREHGVEVLPVDVRWSGEQSTLVAPAAPAGAKGGALAQPHGAPAALSGALGEGAPATSSGALGEGAPLHAVRLGFDRIAGLAAEAAQRIVEARAAAPFASTEDLARRARLDAAALGRWPRPTRCRASTAIATGRLGGGRHRHAADAAAARDAHARGRGRARRAERGRGRCWPITAARPDAQAPPAGAAARELARFQGPAGGGAAHLSATAGWRAPAAWSRTASGPTPPTARSSSRWKTRPAPST